MASADDPFSVVIFGASGDLTRRKLIPALWSLYASRTLPEPFTIIGTARTQMSDAEFKTRMREAVEEFARIKPPSETVWDRFASALTFVVGDPSQADLYAQLGRTLTEVEQRRGGPAHPPLFLAMPPSPYDHITSPLGESRPPGG